MMTFLLRGSVMAAALAGFVASAVAQEQLPWQRQGAYPADNGYGGPARPSDPYQQAQQGTAPDPYAARPPVDRYDYGQGQATEEQPYPSARPSNPRPAYPQRRAGDDPNGAYQQRDIRPYSPPPEYRQPSGYRQYGSNAAPYDDRYRDDRDDRYGNDGRSLHMPHGGGTYSENEVVDAGHRFFGSLSAGLAKAIQWAFKQSGRPNGYILGEDAGGAFVAGLRYGEGRLHTKHYGVHRVFWQGPSIGYDFGGDGNRTMTLVYNLRSPDDLYRRFGGVQGSAYLVGGVSVQFLKADDITLAPIRTGVGLRLGANIGYLKYTRRPTWNPF